jgi:putative hydrolase of the HAD superfamily
MDGVPWTWIELDASDLVRDDGRGSRPVAATIWASDFEASAEAGKFADGAEHLAEFNRRAQSSVTREQWIAARRDAMTVNAETLRIASAARSLRDRHAHQQRPLLRESCARSRRRCIASGQRAHASCQFNARKPQPEVFRRLLDWYDVPAARGLRGRR